jgi:hypothetical protein
LASLGVSLEGRGSSQGDSVDLEPRHCVSEDTLSELDLAHASKCVLGRQHCHLDGELFLFRVAIPKGDVPSNLGF